MIDYKKIALKKTPPPADKYKKKIRMEKYIIKLLNQLYKEVDKTNKQKQPILLKKMKYQKKMETLKKMETRTKKIKIQAW